LGFTAGIVSKLAGFPADPQQMPYFRQNLCLNAGWDFLPVAGGLAAMWEGV
jgi:hypothetical protein